MHLMVIHSQSLSPKKKMTMVMLTMYQSAQTIQQMTLTVLVCLLKTTISQTGIAGFKKKHEFQLAF